MSDEEVITSKALTNKEGKKVEGQNNINIIVSQLHLTAMMIINSIFINIF